MVDWRMQWTVAAPFFDRYYIENVPWLDDFVPPSPEYSFKKIPFPSVGIKSNWHTRRGRNTPVSEWLGFLKQGQVALNEAQGGCITVFPQLANAVGWQKRFHRSDMPLVAWCFNVGALYPGVKQYLARAGLNRVDKFVVHSRRECETVSAWLNLPQSRFEFVPLQRAPISVEAEEDNETPFVLALGSAHRDYKTFFDVVGKLKVKTIVVVNPNLLEHLKIPDNVEIRHGLSYDDCHRLVRQARVNVVPLEDIGTGAGQVTVIDAMKLGKAVVTTRCVGTEDYIEHGKSGLLVKPYNVQEMESAIKQLWHDAPFRDSLAEQGKLFAETTLSDEAAGKRLLKVMEQLS